MFTFHQYCEKREHNVEAVMQALQDLAWMIDVDKDEIKNHVATMDMIELMKHVRDFGLSPPSMHPGRFAAMMKMYSRGNV